jgi:hypothetical protein
VATIDELKGMASSKLGFARTNSYLLELPPLNGVNAGSILGGLPVSLPDPTAFLPQIPGLTSSRNPGSRELNVLCNRATLPSKGISTVDRTIGLYTEKVASTYVVDNVSLTFYLLNDYGVKNYFDAWKDQIINEETGEVGYKNQYAKPVKIHQLRKPQIGKSARLGPLSVNIGLGSGSVYSIELEDAFPTALGAVDFNNSADGIVEFNVSLAFTTWKKITPSQKFINVDIGF